MILHMADSTDPANLPAGMDAYAGYVNGDYQTILRVASRFPHSRIVTIDVNGSAPDRAMCLDVERYDATPEMAPGWAYRCHAAGVAYPWVYVAVSGAQYVADLMGSAPWRLWTAHYTGVPHLCGPQCGFGLERYADATQFVDHGGWDESVVNEWAFPGPKPAPVLAARPVPQAARPEEVPVFIVDAVDSKSQFLVFDNGKVAELASTHIGSGLTAPAGPSGAGLPYIPGTQADVDNIARGYTPA